MSLAQHTHASHHFLLADFLQGSSRNECSESRESHQPKNNFPTRETSSSFVPSRQPTTSLLSIKTIMKLIAATTVAIFASQAAAFQVAPRGASPPTALFAEYEPMEGEGKINLKIDLDSPKVATMVS